MWPLGKTCRGNYIVLPKMLSVHEVADFYCCNELTLLTNKITKITPVKNNSSKLEIG